MFDIENPSKPKQWWENWFKCMICGKPAGIVRVPDAWCWSCYDPEAYWKGLAEMEAEMRNA